MWGLIFILGSFLLEFHESAQLIYWPTRFGARPQKWGVYPDTCYSPCDKPWHTSVLYVVDNDEPCIQYAQWATNDLSTFNLMDLTNWRYICKQPVWNWYLDYTCNINQIVFRILPYVITAWIQTDGVTIIFGLMLMKARMWTCFITRILGKDVVIFLHKERRVINMQIWILVHVIIV